MTGPDDPKRAERFERLFADCHLDVLRYCVRRSDSVEDGEEAAIDTFAVAWRRLDDIREGPEARLWLFGVARKVLSNQRRGARRRGRLQAALAMEAAVAPAIARPAAVDTESPVWQALDALRPTDRELLLLIGWEGLSVGEAAQVVDRPAPWVSVRLSRARKAFAKALVAARAADESAIPIALGGHGERSRDQAGAADDRSSGGAGGASTPTRMLRAARERAQAPPAAPPRPRAAAAGCFPSSVAATLLARARHRPACRRSSTARSAPRRSPPSCARRSRPTRSCTCAGASSTPAERLSRPASGGSSATARG